MSEPSNPIEETPDEFLFVWACGFELGIGVIALVLATLLGVDARAYLDRVAEFDPQAIAYDVVLGALASIPMLIAIALLMRVPHESIREIKRLSDAPTMRALLSLGPAELLAISVCAGIGEELAFRGFLLPWMTSMKDATEVMLNPYQVGDSFDRAVPSLLLLAVLFSSIAFGLLHPITKLYVFVATLMGVYFSVLLIATDSLLVPIVTHAVYDAAQFLMAKRELEAEQATATE